MNFTWSVPKLREDPEQRDERLMRLYEQQIQDIEASNTIYWDGYCGLVKVSDEDLVRRDAAPQNVRQPPPTNTQQQQRDGQLWHPPHQQQGRQHRRAGSAGSGSALSRTPPSGSPRSSLHSSPFKAAPGAAPRSQQPAAVLAEQAAALLQQHGRLHEAEAMLHEALQRCATTQIQLAARIVDLMLECERELQETPTHSRASTTDAEQPHASAGSEGTSGGAEAEALLRQATQALEAGEERRAVSLLQRGLAACPPALSELRRRIALYLELCLCKRQA